MNALTAALTVILSVLVFALPRRLVFVPFVIGIAYFGPLAVVELGPASFSTLRIIVLIGAIRALSRGERLAGGFNRIDGAITAWAIVLILTGLFHTDGAFVYRAGLIWDQLGSYFLFRVFVRDADDVKALFRTICIVLAPMALSMLVEKVTGQNLFAALGGYAETYVRNGSIRARGPFAHPILAGTAGASALLMAACLWKKHRSVSIAGLLASLGIVVTSTSSGPLMMVAFAMLGIAFWPLRQHMRLVRWSSLAAIVALDIVMKDPVYFLMARIDLTGSSQGYFRAQLIRSAIEHLNEWWLIGTDYTRHWMATGNHANTIHTDITNHLLGNGVLGGLPLVTAFVYLLIVAFRGVGDALRNHAAAPIAEQWLAWTTGAVLFAHVGNFFSISLFDQSVVFFYLLLACVGALRVAVIESSTAPANTKPEHGSIAHVYFGQSNRMVRR